MSDSESELDLEQLVTIETFSSPWQAQLARACLESEGIQAVVADEHFYRPLWRPLRHPGRRQAPGPPRRGGAGVRVAAQPSAHSGDLPRHRGGLAFRKATGVRGTREPGHGGTVRHSLGGAPRPHPARIRGDRRLRDGRAPAAVSACSPTPPWRSTASRCIPRTPSVPWRSWARPGGARISRIWKASRRTKRRRSRRQVDLTSFSDSSLIVASRLCDFTSWRSRPKALM